MAVKDAESVALREAIRFARRCLRLQRTLTRACTKPHRVYGLPMKREGLDAVRQVAVQAVTLVGDKRREVRQHSQEKQAEYQARQAQRRQAFMRWEDEHFPFMGEAVTLIKQNCFKTQRALGEHYRLSETMTGWLRNAILTRGLLSREEWRGYFPQTTV